MLAAAAAGCSTMDNQADASAERLAGASAYVPSAAGAQDSFSDAYHYRCTGACFAF